MMARSHVPFAMTWWWVFCLMTSQPVTGYSTLIAGIGGLMPDLDHPKSVLGRKLWFISVPLSVLVGHRGITHSLLAVIVMLGILGMVTAIPEYAPYRWMAAPLCIGYLSHIFGDALTPSGVPLLYPRRRKFSLNLFRTGDWQETVIVGTIGLAVFVAGGVGGQIIDQFADGMEVLRKLQNFKTYE